MGIFIAFLFTSLRSNGQNYTWMDHNSETPVMRAAKVGKLNFYGRRLGAFHIKNCLDCEIECVLVIYEYLCITGRGLGSRLVLATRVSNNFLREFAY